MRVKRAHALHSLCAELKEGKRLNEVEAARTIKEQRELLTLWLGRARDVVDEAREHSNPKVKQSLELLDNAVREVMEQVALRETDLKLVHLWRRTRSKSLRGLPQVDVNTLRAEAFTAIQQAVESGSWDPRRGSPATFANRNVFVALDWEAMEHAAGRTLTREESRTAIAAWRTSGEFPMWLLGAPLSYFDNIYREESAVHSGSDPAYLLADGHSLGEGSRWNRKHEGAE